MPTSFLRYFPRALPVIETLQQIWPHLLSILHPVLAVLGSAHVVLYKRDTRAAAGWVGLICLVPVLGITLYVLLGINRLQRLRGAYPRGGVRGDSRGGSAAPRSRARRKIAGRIQTFRFARTPGRGTYGSQADARQPDSSAAQRR